MRGPGNTLLCDFTIGNLIFLSDYLIFIFFNLKIMITTYFKQIFLVYLFICINLSYYMQTYGTGVIEKEIRGLNVKIDGRNATLSADVPEEEIHEGYGREKSEKVVYTNPMDLLRGEASTSFSLVRFAKVKNFIDGVYATVEERISEQGHRLSREDFLENLERLVSGDVQKYISTARSKQTANEPAMTIPQGFYDWNPQLTDAYRQIKILSRRPGFFVGREDDKDLNQEIMKQVSNAIERGDGLKEAYNTILGLYSRMTGNPESKSCLFPSAELPDQEFFKQLSFKMQSDLPEELGKLLVEAVREGRVSFTPDDNSGLYVRQMHEIIPLVLRDSEEFNKFLVNNKYAEILEREFISQWVGTRHTHVGHISFEDMLLGACIDCNEPIVIRPELRVEPFATSYGRMRSNLDFLGETIKTTLPEVLDRKRLLNDGDRANSTIGEELEEMKLLLRGLELTSRDSIHLPYQNGDAQTAVDKATTWLDNMQNDADLNRNTAIFVPIIRTTDGSRQISYIDAGFKTIEVNVYYKDKPLVDISGAESFFGGYEFEISRYRFPVLVHREVRVPYEKLINDRGLREMLKDSFTESELDDVVQRLEQ